MQFLKRKKFILLKAIIANKTNLKENILEDSTHCNEKAVKFL